MESNLRRDLKFENIHTLVTNYYEGVEQTTLVRSCERACLTYRDTLYLQNLINTLLEDGGSVGIVEWPRENKPMQATVIQRNSMQRAINYKNKFLPSEASFIPEEDTYEIHIGISPKDFILVFKSGSSEITFVFDNNPKSKQRRGALLYKEPGGKWQPLLGVNLVRNQMNWVLFEEGTPELSFT
ncbi:MAG: hypothetical protein AAB694_00255 [Patescibacteria group bacterium]